MTNMGQGSDLASDRGKAQRCERREESSVVITPCSRKVFIAASSPETLVKGKREFAFVSVAIALGLFLAMGPTRAFAAAPPIAAYDFEAGSGSTLTDLSNNSHPGTLVNGPTWTNGKYAGGLAFDGVNDYVSMGDVAQTDGLNAITVSSWVKFAVNGGGAAETHLIDKSQCTGKSGGGPWELGVSLFGTHKAEFVVYPQGGRPSAYVPSGPGFTSIDDGAWHYVTGRYDGTNLSIWVDGNLENSRAVSGLTLSSSNSSVELGGHCNGHPYPFKGTLDDVRIYDRALTPAEILGDMATPVGNGTVPPPVDTSAPSTPAGLSASGVTTSQVTLAWQASTDNVGVAGYRVYRDGSLAGTVSSTSFTASGLASNTSYAFTVAAFDAAGNSSSQSAPLSVTTTPAADTTAPSTPGGLSASGVTTSQATLAWQASTDNVGVAGYRIYRDGSLAGTVSSTSFIASGLTANTSYAFAVAAFDVAGNSSSQSALLSVTTAPAADTTAPSMPAGLSASGVTTSQATLAWQASTDNVGVAGYRIYRDGSLAGTVSSTSFTVTGLISNTSYAFTVAAFDAAGNSSSQSAPLSVTTAPASSGNPSLLAAYDFDAGSGGALADLSNNGHPGTLVNGPAWTSGKYTGGLAFDGVNDYVSMGDVAQTDGLKTITISSWVKFAASVGGETHLIDKSQCTGKSNGGPWELGVGLSSAHKAEFVVYPQSGRPSAYVLSGASSTSIDDGTWHYVAGRYDGTTLSVWVDGQLENSRAVSGLTLSSSNSSVELGGHCNGHPYPFKGTLDDVRIYDRALTPAEILGDMATPVGNGTAPPPVDTSAPSTPAGLSASGVTTSQVTLAWQASTDNVGVAGYRVYRDGSLAGTVSSTSFTASGLASNTSYAFTVAAFDAAGNSSSQSAPLSVTTAAVSATASYSTTFAANENPLSEGGVWTTGKTLGLDWNDVQTGGGNAYATAFNNLAVAADDSIAQLSSNIGIGVDQTISGTIHRAPGYNSSGQHEIELFVRMKITAHNARGYEVNWNAQNNYAQIVRWNGALSNYTYLKEIAFRKVPADGDVVKVTAIGTSPTIISVYLNGSFVDSATDSTWSDGQPGIGFWATSGDTFASFGWASIEASGL